MKANLSIRILDKKEEKRTEEEGDWLFSKEQSKVSGNTDEWTI